MRRKKGKYSIFHTKNIKYMGKLKSFEELTNNRKQLELSRRERMQEMYDYVKERGDLREEELKQLKTEDRRIYKEMREEIKKYANEGINQEIKGMTETEESIICVIVVAIFISFIGMFITGYVELCMATIFTGLCIMIGMAIRNNISGKSEEIRAKKEEKVRAYRFTPKKEKVQQIREEKEETLEEWCRRKGWNTPEEEINKVYKPEEYKPLTYEDIEKRLRKERPDLMPDYE